jgi:hypothetical protein
VNPFRVYEPEECGKDGYPFAWHKIDGGSGVKHLVREEAGHRCIRCEHPYRNGAHGNGEWSQCDERCFCNDYHPFKDPYTRTRWQYEGESGEGIEIIEARWRILTVHHLRLGDDAKRDLRWWNLAALCQRCHLQIQGKVVLERIWPWPHSEWFKPYAAGWYAWAYLGEDLDRETTMARLDELLALEGVVA